jgi:hypothetical protein
VATFLVRRLAARVSPHLVIMGARGSDRRRRPSGAHSDHTTQCTPLRRSCCDDGH